MGENGESNEKCFVFFAWDNVKKEEKNAWFILWYSKSTVYRIKKYFSKISRNRKKVYFCSVEKTNGSVVQFG